VEVARFHIGDSVSVALTGLPEIIEPHVEPIKKMATITMPDIGHVQAAVKLRGTSERNI